MNFFEELQRVRQHNKDQATRWIVIGLGDWKPFKTSDRAELIRYMASHGRTVEGDPDENCPDFANMAGPFTDSYTPGEARYDTWDTHEILST